MASIAAETKLSVNEALEEIEALLLAASSAGSPHRLSAVRYTMCRAALLDSALRPVLPGFLMQCVSLYKFHEFIHLYDPRPDLRAKFIERAFADCRPRAASRRVYDAFGDLDF